MGVITMEHIDRENNYYIAVFGSRNYAIYLYHYLNKNKLSQYELVPTPCKIKAGCGYSIQFEDFKHYSFLQKLAERNNIQILAIYAINRRRGRRTLKKIDVSNKE